MRSGGSKSSTPATDGGRPRATLVYDDDCGPCSKFAAAVRRLDRKGRIELVSMHDKDVEGRLRPKLGAKYDLAFHLILEPEGTVLSGEDALHDLARLLPAVKPLADVVYAIPGVRRAPGALYGSFAKGRQCALHPEP